MRPERTLGTTWFGRSLRRPYEEEIAQAFASHPDAGLFRELPGAGKVVGPRQLAAFGTDRTRFANASQLQCSSGIAPVKEKSGGRVWIHWRWRAPWFVRQTLVEWAGQSILYCAWARAYYDQQKTKGKRHWAIVRALAFRWLRILWKCWATRTPYDESRYLNPLAKHDSPLVAATTTTKTQFSPRSVPLRFWDGFGWFGATGDVVPG